VCEQSIDKVRKQAKGRKVGEYIYCKLLWGQQACESANMGKKKFEKSRIRQSVSPSHTDKPEVHTM